MYQELLTGSRVALVLLNMSHVTQYVAMFSAAVRAMLHVPDAACEQQYIQEQLALPGDHFFYAVFTTRPYQLIGAPQISDGGRYPGQLYTWINEQFLGTGHWHEAFILGASHYFAHHDDGFTAHVDCENMRSYKALKKEGLQILVCAGGACGKQYQLLLRKEAFLRKM